MAVLQSSLKYLIVNNSIRLLCRNPARLQSSRGKHVLVFRLGLPINTLNINKSKILSNSNLKHIYRLASTNIKPEESGATDLKNTEPNVAGKSDGPNVFSSEVTNEAGHEAATPLASNIVIDEASLPPIPSVEEPVAAALEFVSTGLKEPSLQSLGLGSNWPPGLIQQLLEYLHISWDLPWWGAISIVTIIFRIVLFPVALKAKKSSVAMNNSLPQLQALNDKLTTARQTGDYYNAALYTQEMQEFLKSKALNPMTSMLPMAIQAPIFISVFWALKGMANAPVESMKTGGLFWFQDLTVHDPYYILPVMAAFSLLIILEVGADGIAVASMKYNWIKYALRGFPFILIPFSAKFSQAILLYWLTSNSVTLLQVCILKIPAVKNYLKIPDAIVHNKEALPKKKGMIQGFKEGMANAKITRELVDRERLNAVTFEQAGKGPVPRTFKRNPKLVSQNAPASGK